MTLGPKATVGLEPTVGVLQTPALTTWLRRRQKRGSPPDGKGTAGAEDEIRTRDPLLGKEMLYQLSHFRFLGGKLRRRPGAAAQT